MAGGLHLGDFGGNSGASGMVGRADSLQALLDHSAVRSTTSVSTRASLDIEARLHSAWHYDRICECVEVRLPVEEGSLIMFAEHCWSVGSCEDGRNWGKAHWKR